MEEQNKDHNILESIKQMDYFKVLLNEEKEKINKKANKKINRANVADTCAAVAFMLPIPASIIAIPASIISGHGIDYGLFCFFVTLFGGFMVSSIPFGALLLIRNKIKKKAEALIDETKKYDAKAEELEQMKHLLDQTLLREGVDLSVLKERYKTIISDKDKLLENEDEDKEELHALYPLLKKYQTRIKAINKVVEEEKQKEYLEEIHQKCAQILDAESMVIEYSGGKALLKARGI